MAYRSFLEVLAGSHPPRYAASLKPSSPRFNPSSETDPADLITPHLVRDYVTELNRLGNKPGTIHVRLEHLREVAKVFAPDRDWSFIARAMARVHVQRRERDPFFGGRAVTSDELLDLGLRLMEDAQQNPHEVRSLDRYRDGLLISFLSLVPIRLRNLADLTIGGTLIKVGDSWMVVLPPDSTKTHRHLEYEWPGNLVPALEEYLRSYRPMLLQRHGRWHRDAGQNLWVSLDGSPMPFGAISDRLARHTKRAFGFALRAHAFRHIAVTTFAIHDPEHVRAAAPLLGHSSFNTTERSYNLAKSLEAQRKFAAVMSPPSRS